MVIHVGILTGLFKSRDKPKNSINGSSYRFLFGGSTSGKSVNERSAMQMTAVYACVRILAKCPKQRISTSFSFVSTQ